MEVVMQMMYSYSLELLAAAVGLMLLLELVTLRKINKWKKKEKEQFSELEEKLSRISEKQKEMARENILLEKWKFYFGELNDAVKKNFNDSEWENVIVPHDWAIDKPFDMRIDMQSVQVLEDGDKAPKMRTGRTGALPAFGIGYYRTSFKSDESMVGKRIRIEFDGAMSLAKVYLNGEYVGEWPYGYSSFAFDITDKWNFNGENIIAVRLENKPESSRWYSGAGLYRNVRLVVTEPVSVGHWGTYITTPNVSARKAGLNIETCVVNKTGNEVKVRLESLLMDADGKLVKSHRQQKV